MELRVPFLKICDDLPLWGKAMVAGGVTLALYLPLKYYVSRPRKSPIKADFEEDVVYLYQFPRTRSIPSVSPFCLKLETWLRMADIYYENVDCGVFTRSLEGTVPFIEYNGREYPDSALAIRDMSLIHSTEQMEIHLTEEQLSVSRALEKLAEHSLMVTVAQLRWTDFLHQLFEHFPDDLHGISTPITKWLTKLYYRSHYLEAVKLTGIGRHSRSEILNIAAEDLRALSGYLGDKDYFMGFRPTRVDASVFGVLAQIIYAPYDLPQKKRILEDFNNLRDFCDRVKERYWPDWEECITTLSLNANRKKKLYL